LSSSMASVHVAGFIDKTRVVRAFESLDNRWEAKEVFKPSYVLPENSIVGNLYFIDVPNAKQSFLIAGRLTIPASDPDFNNLKFGNEILGGGSSGKLFQVLRIEKGYTYGAYSFLRENRVVSPLIAYSSVRANATKSSLEIIMDLLEKYGSDYSEDDAETTKNKILKGNTRAFESMNAKLSIVRNISKYGKSMTYLEEDQKELIDMTVDDFKSIIDEYITEDQMVYLVVGDKASQLSEVNQLGKGNAIVLDIHGNPLND
ncbi:MAG: insulinase family protein, partial [Bacteroidetes bacterium]